MSSSQVYVWLVCDKKRFKRGRTQRRKTLGARKAISSSPPLRVFPSRPWRLNPSFKEIKMAKTTAEIIVERLIDWGVGVVFGLPGDGINGIMEALRTHQDQVRFIQVRHEESAAFMACGYAKYTGKLGVCVATS